MLSYAPLTRAVTRGYTGPPHEEVPYSSRGRLTTALPWHHAGRARASYGDVGQHAPLREQAVSRSADRCVRATTRYVRHAVPNRRPKGRRRDIGSGVLSYRAHSMRACESSRPVLAAWFRGRTRLTLPSLLRTVLSMALPTRSCAPEGRLPSDPLRTVHATVPRSLACRLGAAWVSLCGILDSFGVEAAHQRATLHRTTLPASTVARTTA